MLKFFLWRGKTLYLCDETFPICVLVCFWNKDTNMYSVFAVKKIRFLCIYLGKKLQQCDSMISIYRSAFTKLALLTLFLLVKSKIVCSFLFKTNKRSRFASTKIFVVFLCKLEARKREENCHLFTKKMF